VANGALSAHVVLVDPLHLRRVALARYLESHLGLTVTEVTRHDEEFDVPDTARGLIVINAGGARLRDDSDLRRTLQRLRQSAPEAALVLLSDHDDRAEVLDAMGLGIAGFIPNGMSPHTVLATLQMIQAGGEYAPRHTMMQDKNGAGAQSDHDGVLNGAAVPEKTSRTPSVQFTERQKEVLELMRRGKPNKEIAYLLNMKESTVKVHVRNIMRKLSVTNRTQAAYLATQMREPHTL
jgi:DNA-binding NarL/FixJ family response regulator